MTRVKRMPNPRQMSEAPPSRKAIHGWGGAASVNHTSTAEVGAVLGVRGRQVWLRFRERPREMLFGEVVESPPGGVGSAAIVPWGTSRPFRFDVSQLRSLGVAVGFSYARFSGLCADQRALARAGRFA